MTLQETRAYDDIINLPHHQSRKHPHMSRHQRAAQFMPFAALTGYNQVIEQNSKKRRKPPSLRPKPKAIPISALDNRSRWRKSQIRQPT